MKKDHGPLSNEIGTKRYQGECHTRMSDKFVEETSLMPLAKLDKSNES